jgi:hypothetical protein
MERAGPLKLSWAHALFISAMAINLLSIPQMDAVLLHVLLNGFGWGALYETTNDFAPSGVPPPGSSRTSIGRNGCLIEACSHLQTKPYLPTAVGVALGVLSHAFSGAASATYVAPPNATNLTGALPGGMPGQISYPSVIGFQLAGAVDGGGSSHVLLNLAPSEQTISLSCTAHTSYSSPDPSGSPAAWVTTTAPVRSSRRQCVAVGLGGAAHIVLPPYSLNVVA